MSKKMLINATLPEEDRVAIVEDGILTELDIEIAGRQQTKSNIYKGEVIRVEQGLQAAFIDYGAQRPGFLQIGEIHPSLYPKRDDDSTHKRPAITDILKRGQQLLVQVVKEERGTKGAALTTEISLPGRYMVLMPESSSRGISRKIDNDQVRKGIKQAMASLDLPDNMGYIIRTAAIDQPPEELKRDFDYLLNTYNSIISHSEKAKAPALIYQESNLVIRSIRDYFTPEIDEVLIDDREVFQKARDFFKAVMPEYAHLVKLHQERRPIFARYQIEEQISQLSSNTVNLPSGGSIVLDQTEALVAIDVNSGKMASEQDVEATAHRVNVEAATEVARQLRLRDMGGLIVIDFIDMRQRKNAREVEKTLKSALKIDKARVTVGRISHQFGLLEMSRQRIKANLGEGTYHVCPHCQGTGRIRSEESRSVALLRRIQAGTAKGNIETVRCIAALDTANYLLNTKRHELFDLEQRYKLTIEIKGDALYQPEQVEIDFIKQSRDNNGQQQLKELTPLVDIDLSERATIEVAPLTASPADESSDEDTKITSDEQGEREPTKRPRRRRRSGRRRSDRQKDGEQAVAGSDATPQAQQAQETTDQSAPQAPAGDVPAEQKTSSTQQPAVPQTDEATPSSRPPAAQETTPATGDETATTVASEEPKKKPARRRRTPQKSEEPQLEENAATAATVPPADETEAKPKRTTRRKTTTKKADASATEQTPDNASVMSEETEAEKKPTRRRRTTPKSEESQQESSTATTAEQPAGEAEEKPKRTTRRKATAKKPETETTQADAEAAPQTKPTRRRTTPKSAEAPKEATADATAVTKPATAAEEKPKRTTRPKTAPPKEDAAPAEGATPASADTESASEKKPVRRRRTTKKTGEESSATPPQEGAAAEAATEVVEKPKRTTRRKTATKKADTAPAEDTTSASADTEAATEKKPVRRRRTTKKTTGTTDADSSAAATAEEKPKRRAPRRKKSEEAPSSPPVEEN